MKNIYFVRHGESTSNAGDIFHGAEAMLTKKGVEEAQFVAKRFTHISIGTILSSNYPRALDTAQEIANVTHKEVEIVPSLHERVRPSFLVGLPRSDPTRNEYERAFEKSLYAGNRTFKHSDDESFEDLLTRAKSTKEHLELRPENQILAVTHGTFLRFLHAYIIFGDALTPQEFSAVLHSHTASNTGITVYEVQAPTKEISKHAWKLRTWMDVAHLGE